MRAEIESVQGSIRRDAKFSEIAKNKKYICIFIVNIKWNKSFLYAFYIPFLFLPLVARYQCREIIKLFLVCIIEKIYKYFFILDTNKMCQISLSLSSNIIIDWLINDPEMTLPFRLIKSSSRFELSMFWPILPSFLCLFRPVMAHFLQFYLPRGYLYLPCRSIFRKSFYTFAFSQEALKQQQQNTDRGRNKGATGISCK